MKRLMKSALEVSCVPGLWKMAREAPKHADLIGRAGAAAGQYQSERIGECRHGVTEYWRSSSEKRGSGANGRIYILMMRILALDKQIAALDLHCPRTLRPLRRSTEDGPGGHVELAAVAGACHCGAI